MYPRKFKRLFYEYLSIDEKHEVHNGPLKEGENVTVILTPPISSLHLLGEIPDIYLRLLDEFINMFKYDHTNVKKHVLLLPRQKLENYPSNDRQYNWSKLIDVVGLKNVLNTDEVENLKQDQMERIANNEIIVLTDGSPFLVNGVLFCRGKDVYLVNADTTPVQEAQYPRKKLLVDIIRKNNKLHYVSVDDMIHILRSKE